MSIRGTVVLESDPLRVTEYFGELTWFCTKFCVDLVYDNVKYKYAARSFGEVAFFWAELKKKI